MRFLAPVAALADGTTRFTGDPAAARRPIGPLLDALERLGVATRRPVGASLPFEVSGRGRVAGGPVTLDASASSQFLSALLLAAPRFAAGARVVLEPRRLPSRPHVAMTLEALAAFGARSTAHGDYAWEVAPGGLAGREITVEPDLTSAAPFLAAALVAPGTVRLRGWPRRTTQAGALMLDYLTAFGGQTAWRDGALAATGTGPISPVRLDLRDAGELTPVVAALATLADGPSRLDGIAHLRGHETDRLAALEREINRLGARAEQTADGITITPAPLRGALVRTYGDHRMAMFGAVVALKTPGVVVEDLGATAKTFPGFAAAWEAML
jgi:3-phosphoshikimate 1-carboxyvinyltransferase